MTRLLALGALACALLLSACADAPDAPPAAGTANDAVTTPVERPAAAVDPFDAEPGIDGGASPLSVFSVEGSDCYVYPSHVVVVARDPGVPEAPPTVTLTDRSDDATPQDDCLAEPTLDLSAALGGVDRFVAIQDSLVIAVQRPGPEGRGGPTLFVHNVNAAETVLEEAYAEPLAVADGGLLFGAPPTTMRDAAALAEAGVDCPEAADILARGAAVGASIRMRYDFATGETTATDDIVCLEMDA